MGRSEQVLQKGSGRASPDAATGWNLLREEVSLPAAVLYQSRIENNLRWMQTFADGQQMQLAPHGKTTMAPALFARQLQAGAWGITLATATQAAAAFAHGVRRVLMANQLVGKQNMAIISELQTRQLDFYCLVDSVDNVKQLDRFFSERNQTIKVLIEIGVTGGRCGCRSSADIAQLVAGIHGSQSVRLAGIETYEGVIHSANPEQDVHSHINAVKALCEKLLADNAFHTDEVLLTGAGSAWYDVVADVFSAGVAPRIVPVIRPGCYLVHDQGLCHHGQQKIVARSTAVNDVIDELGSDLQSAMEIWAYVQSIPEPGTAVITMGKRDVAFDAGLPMPVLHYRPGDDEPVAASDQWVVRSMMDQHAMLGFPAADDLRVGDIIAFATSHPCLTFDKWQQINLITDDYIVVDVIHTFF